VVQDNASRDSEVARLDDAAHGEMQARRARPDVTPQVSLPNQTASFLAAAHPRSACQGPVPETVILL